MQAERRRTLWALTRGERLRYGAAVGAMAVAIALGFLVPLVIEGTLDGPLGGAAAAGEAPEGLARRFVELGGEHGLRAALVAAALAVVLLTALSGVAEYLHGRWSAQASEAVTRGLRGRLYAHLHRLPCAWHDEADTGDLVQRCSSDVETVRVFLANQVVSIARAVLLVVIVLPILFSLDARMALVSVALFPVILTFAVVFFRRVKRLFLDVDQAEGRMSAVLQENLSGIRVVRAFARQDFEEEKFGEANARYRDLDVRLLRMLGTYWSVSDFVCLAQVGLVLVPGALWVASGELTVGTLYAFLTYEWMIIWPVRHLGRVLTDTGKAIVALGRIGEVLEAAPEPEVLGAAPLARPALGRVVARGLVHGFGGERNALDGLDLAIEPGETVALLGPPGSGKSTFVHLLLRLYAAEAGSLTLDGREVEELPLQDVRGAVVAVLQEPFLYSRSLAENLRLGSPAATEAELAAAVHAAALTSTIEGFPGGYETVVGEKGVTLSGGQRQRVSLARALLLDPPVLVLDDSLSAVDTRTEAHILDALAARRGKRTTILIAHRLSSVLHADRVVVLEAGHVRQEGTHAELLRQEGPYRRLWGIQGLLEEELGADLEAATHAKGGTP